MHTVRLSAIALVSSLVLGEAAAAQATGPASATNAPPALRPFQVISMDPAFERLIALDTQLETIVTLPSLRGEGPIWRNGKLWILDMRQAQVIEVALNGTHRVVLENAGGPMSADVPTLQGANGQANWRDGAVLLCRSALRDIGVMYRDGRIDTFIPNYEGRRFNSPNDITVAKDGSVWFTDPPLSLPGHPRARPADPTAPPASMTRPMDKQIPFNGVFRFKDGKLTAAITDMPTPNGLAFSPDGKVLYVSNTEPEMFVRAYAVNADGALSDERELIRIPADNPYGNGLPDGLKVDSKGNVWTTGPGGLLVVSPSGKLLGRIQLPSRATNITFGGDYKSLFIISNPHIYRIRTRVHGLVPPFAEP
jgi:gluconolactonase